MGMARKGGEKKFFKSGSMNSFWKSSKFYFINPIVIQFVFPRSYIHLRWFYPREADFPFKIGKTATYWLTATLEFWTKRQKDKYCDVRVVSHSCAVLFGEFWHYFTKLWDEYLSKVVFSEWETNLSVGQGRHDVPLCREGKVD